MASGDHQYEHIASQLDTDPLLETQQAQLPRLEDTRMKSSSVLVTHPANDRKTEPESLEIGMLHHILRGKNKSFCFAVAMAMRLSKLRRTSKQVLLR